MSIDEADKVMSNRDMARALNPVLLARDIGFPKLHPWQKRHAVSTCRSTITGRVNANVDPSPGCDSTQILPRAFR
jgi:hypothetical protein